MHLHLHMHDSIKFNYYRSRVSLNKNNHFRPQAVLYEPSSILSPITHGVLFFVGDEMKSDDVLLLKLRLKKKGCIISMVIIFRILTHRLIISPVFFSPGQFKILNETKSNQCLFYFCTSDVRGATKLV